MKYIKKPVVIEAFEYTGEYVVENWPDWALQAYSENQIFYIDFDGMYIRTLEGLMRVSVGDYVIQGVQGELYPCKPDIFKQTYERLD